MFNAFCRWKVGSLTRKIAYNAQYQNTAGHSYLSVYGWTRFPVIEYYIVENFDGPQSPHQAAVKMGSVTTDGGTYDILRAVVSSNQSYTTGLRFLTSIYAAGQCSTRGGAGDQKLLPVLVGTEGEAF